MALTVSDIKPHRDAMEAIFAALKPFKPEEQMVIVAGVLGDVLATVGEKPSQDSATMLVGIAMDMVLDMVRRNFETAA